MHVGGDRYEQPIEINRPYYEYTVTIGLHSNTSPCCGPGCDDWSVPSKSFSCTFQRIEEEPHGTEKDIPFLSVRKRRRSPHLDEIVRNHAQPHPTAHTVQTGIEATSQTVSSFEHANSALRAGSPLLPVTKPTLVLKKFALATCGFLVGHRHPTHPQRLPGFLALARIKSPSAATMRGIRPNLCWCTSIEDSNRVESAGRSANTSKWVTIWFSAS